MTPQERKLIAELFDRLAALESNPRDPDAEAMIREGLRRAPNGVYSLVQTVLVQEEALKQAKARIEAKFPGRRVTIGRAAVLTVPHLGRAACHYCGPCWRGCSTGSYFSTQSSTLPAARATVERQLASR